MREVDTYKKRFFISRRLGETAAGAKVQTVIPRRSYKKECFYQSVGGREHKGCWRRIRGTLPEKEKGKNGRNFSGRTRKGIPSLDGGCVARTEKIGKWRVLPSKFGHIKGRG